MLALNESWASHALPQFPGHLDFSPLCFIICLQVLPSGLSALSRRGSSSSSSSTSSRRGRVVVCSGSSGNLDTLCFTICALLHFSAVCALESACLDREEPLGNC